MRNVITSTEIVVWIFIRNMCKLNDSGRHKIKTSIFFFLLSFVLRILSSRLSIFFAFRYRILSHGVLLLGTNEIRVCLTQRQTFIGDFRSPFPTTHTTVPSPAWKYIPFFSFRLPKLMYVCFALLFSVQFCSVHIHSWTEATYINTNNTIKIVVISSSKRKWKAKIKEYSFLFDFIKELAPLYFIGSVVFHSFMCEFSSFFYLTSIGMVFGACLGDWTSRVSGKHIF